MASSPTMDLDQLPSVEKLLQGVDVNEELLHEFQLRWSLVESEEFAPYLEHFIPFRDQFQGSISSGDIIAAKVALKRFKKRLDEFIENKDTYDGYKEDLDRWHEFVDTITREQAIELKILGAWKHVSERSQCWPTYSHPKNRVDEYLGLKQSMQKLYRRLNKNASKKRAREEREEVDEHEHDEESPEEEEIPKKMSKK